MKLTKQKLYQLIMEEYKSRSRRIFDKRREIPHDAGFTPVGHEDRTIDYPQHQAKLTSIATSGPEGYHQAKDLADTLDEPLYMPMKSGNEKTERILTPDQEGEYYGANGPYFTHVRYVMWANSNGYPELTFTDEIVPEAVRAFANAEGLDYEKTLSAVKFNLSNNKKAQMKKHIRKFDPDREMAMTHGLDYDPFDYDDDSEF